MKRNNRKGFTTVELVIVIAVIAILATALIPTFSGLINSANSTSRDQAAKNLYNAYLLDTADDVNTGADDSYFILVDGYVYTVTGGNLVLKGEKLADGKSAPEVTTTHTFYIQKATGEPGYTRTPAAE